jgi:hypothetical protein
VPTAMADHRDLTTPAGVLPTGALDTSSTTADHAGLSTRPSGQLSTDHDEHLSTVQPAPVHADHTPAVHPQGADLSTDVEDTEEAPAARRRWWQRRSKAERLRDDAAEAARLRTYQTHPDVAALRIERVRGKVDALIWSGLVMGLLFTMSNVAEFAGQGAKPGSVKWVIGWLLDPMVSLVLVGMLVGCAVIARYQIKATAWVNVAKWGALTATYTMNTWSAWAALVPSQIVLHSVPPAIVFVAAEALTDLRNLITEAVSKAHEAATKRAKNDWELASLTSGQVDSRPVDSRTRPAGGQRKSAKAAERGQRPVQPQPRQVDSQPSPAVQDSPVDSPAAPLPKPELHIAGGTDQDRMIAELDSVYRDSRGNPTEVPGRPTVMPVMQEKGFQGWTNAQRAADAIRALRKQREERAV